MTCQRCLGEHLAGTFQDDRGGTPLAPFIGTAFHAHVERLAAGYDFLLERRVHVGTIDGYGDITGTVDAYDPEHGHVLDWKVLGKKKITGFKAAASFTPDGGFRDTGSRYSTQLRQYYHQQQLYGLGLSNDGWPVSRLSLLLVPRDCTIETFENDVHEITFAYNSEVAGAVFDRAASIYKWITDGGDTEALASDPECYYCRYKRDLVEITPN